MNSLAMRVGISSELFIREKKVAVCGSLVVAWVANVCVGSLSKGLECKREHGEIWFSYLEGEGKIFKLMQKI